MLLILGVVYWFGIRDDSDEERSASAKQPTVQTFSEEGVPFTFEYPANFAESEGPAGFVWIAGVGPYDILDVKRIANVPRSIGRLKSSNREALSARPDVKIVGEGTDKRAGVDMVRFEVTSMVDGLELRSQLYYFSLGGVTWQFECESQAKRAEIDAACTQALSTFAVLS